jgi:hypothetical protein
MLVAIAILELNFGLAVGKPGKPYSFPYGGAYRFLIFSWQPRH